MAGKPKSMSQIKQLLLLHQQGKGKKTIARLLGMSRATVKVYLQKLQLLTSSAKGTKPFSVAELVKLEDPVLEAKFHPGNPAYKDGRYETFSTNLGYYLKELKRTGVTKRLLWEEYRQQYPNGYGYSQFCYHLQQQQKASRPTMVLEHKPAEKLYMDFAGKKFSYIDKQTGGSWNARYSLPVCRIPIIALP
jgi:hypothetical protein